MSKMTQVALERLCKAMTVNPECHDLVSIALSAATRIERLETEKIPQLNISLAKASLRIAELEAAQKEALLLLPELERGHYYCDDCWYSCPKAVDGCCDESRGDECDCGADDYNALLAKIIGLLTPEAQQ